MRPPNVWTMQDAGGTGADRALLMRRDLRTAGSRSPQQGIGAPKLALAAITVTSPIRGSCKFESAQSLLKVGIC